MIYVAKSYKDLEKIGEPYVKSNRSYIKVRTKTGGEKEVRVYTEAEYCKMYPEVKVEKTGYVVKNILGFGSNGYICLPKTKDEQWLAVSPCRFHCAWGWYYDESFGELSNVPADLAWVILDWEKVGNADGTLKDRVEVEKVVKCLLR